VNARSLAGQLVDDDQRMPVRGAPQFSNQPSPLAPRQLGMEQQHPASPRKPSDRLPQRVAEPRIGDQPLARDSLAALHRASYSRIPMGSADERRQQILDGIAAAARLARRDPGEVILIAVSKTRSAQEIEELVAAGQRDFGESRVQEALAKWPPVLARHPQLRLHCVGRLQSNKAADAVRLFDSIHSLDRRSLLDALAREAEKAARIPSVYVQVNIGEEEQKGGCALAEVGALVAGVRESPLPLAGLMCIPPLGLEPAPYFALLAKIAEEHAVEGLSMGMSADYRSAVMLGSTAVRVGTALFEDE